MPKKAKRKTTSAKLKRKLSDDMLNNLVVPGRKGGSNLVSVDEMKEQVQSALQNGDQLKGDKSKYRLTPKGVLWAIIEKFYNGEGDISKFESFQKDLVEHLSMVASGNQKNDMFGHDFNDFFSIVVTTMNLLEKTISMLNENGIECDIRELLEGEDGDGD